MKIIGYLIAALFVIVGSVLIFVVGNTDQIISMGINSCGVSVLGLILAELSKKLNQ
ncbi:MAG: hypothetical protein ACPGUE_11220 [Marinomonas sp.]